MRPGQVGGVGSAGCSWLWPRSWSRSWPRSRLVRDRAVARVGVAADLVAAAGCTALARSRHADGRGPGRGGGSLGGGCLAVGGSRGTGRRRFRTHSSMTNRDRVTDRYPASHRCSVVTWCGAAGPDRCGWCGGDRDIRVPRRRDRLHSIPAVDLGGLLRPTRCLLGMVAPGTHALPVVQAGRAALGVRGDVVQMPDRGITPRRGADPLLPGAQERGQALGGGTLTSTCWPATCRAG